MSNDHPPPLSDEGYCARCDGIFSAAGFDKMRSIEGYFHSRKLDMERTAEQGCPLCQKIVSELVSHNYNSNDVALTFYVYSDRVGDRAAWQAWRRAIWSGRGEGIEQGSGTKAPPDRPESLIAIDRQSYASVEIGLLAEEGGSLACSFPLRPPETRVDSPHVVQKAMEWFKECRESHARCVEHNNAHSFVPTRLLEVGAGSAARIYLKDMSAKSNCDYATLSYCWGGSQPRITTVANLEEHMTRGIPVDDLPATIQDAISVARCLGLQYLWIDALCIIQDDDADKAREVGSMGKVYRTATITICASTAKAVSEGFLSSLRQPPEVMQKRLHLSDEIHGTIGWAIVCRVDNSLDHPLDGRAWTMQEYFLSPRRLVYSKYELIWDCYTIGPRTLTTSHLKYAFPISDDARTLCGPDGNAVAAMTPWAKSRSWREMLDEYTMRSMTFSADRLNAVLGIADEVCNLWGDSHLFGLLRSDVILQLAWNIEEPTRDVRSDRGPSWAWVSTTDSGWVKFIQEGTEDMTMKPDACFVGVADDDQRRLFLEARLAEADEAKFPMVMVEPLDDGDRNLYPDLKNYNRMESDRLLLLGRAQVQYNTGLSDVALVVREVETGTYRRQGFVYFTHDLAGYDRSVWDKYKQQKVILL